MRHAVLMAAVVAMVLATAAQTAAAQEEEEIPYAEGIEHQMMDLELRQREDEAEFDCQERELELEERRLEIDRMRGKGPGHQDGGHGFFILLVIITNILLTVWVCKDMREQKIGRALWVPIVLLAGVFGAILYAIVRVADTRGKAAEA